VCQKINQKNKRICTLILYCAIIPVEFLYLAHDTLALLIVQHLRRAIPKP
jgi:hypothetical protein